ncbi:uncharacterized protein B0H18DRAFT_1095185 [Fomitopsis serialis]|uniref:uncharacterized protein n=1 Tax=Fomitopsis serialis TaxID=139415 RepID=UPI0020072E8E|nr:uncharacterized protein B0H18DRAFT_1095185 [Neoantrodia serialis]KAH9924070.1 hypothetical protein B0H18DRAFT_1095185 [Neoantrodia serialis]
MAAKTQNHSPFSRISRLIRSGPSSPLAREPDVEPPTQEDWYIPYNGPYEPPRGMPESVVERDSWGNLDPQATKREDRYARTSRDRAKSDAATLASSSAPTPRHRSFSTRNTPRPSVNSIIHAGGVGEAPVPVREPQEAQPKPETTRHSLASILSLGTRRGLTIRHSSSAGQLTRQAGPAAALAYAPAATTAFLQPTPRNRLTIRGSISTPNLRNPQTTSQPRSPAPPTPKGKQRWLSPETWCDALILPRPRFAIRVDPGGGSGRIVSPPDSPVQPNTITYYQSRAEKEPTTGSSHGLDRADSHEPLLAAQNTRPRASTVEPIAGPSRVTVEEQRQAVGFQAAKTESFALDDLALPSPAPLTDEEGRQLEADREAWQAQATRSFQNKRARSMSRARAKTLRRTSAMDMLTQRTLLGNQSRPPTVNSQGFRTSEDPGTATFTSGGVGISTVTSHSHGRTRSHAHSNSAGTATSSHGRTEESFMWTGSGAGHHQRTPSLGKSALRLVKNTASTAAGFCGFASAERVFEGGRETDEKAGAPDMQDGAHRRQDTRVLRLQDQARRDAHQDNVVLVTPASPEHGVAQTVHIGLGGLHGLSPVPSSSGESPIGIAISTPTPSDEQARQHYGGRERLRLPAHPYAQGATFPMRSSSPEPERSEPRLSDTRHEQAAGDEGLERHRQPVLVHPYAPFAQANHPYASASPAWAIEEAPQASMQPAVTVDPPTDEGGQMIEVQADTTSSMFAEITPGHIREFQPEQLRYSPFIMVHPVEQKADGLSSGARSHPYVAQSRRMSEWGFADALTETLRDRGSVDSGLGTSESLDHLRNTDRSGQRADTRPMPADLPPVPLEDPSERLRPGMRRREATRSSSNHTLASSPMDSVNPPSFRAQPTEERLTTNGQSSGSSPGMISHDSSPPLSPRSFNASDDLERFRDLFYQPPPRPETPEEARLDTFSPPTPSRQPSSGVSTRSVSGLTTLARQLADDIDELRQISRDSMDDSEASPMWGRRFGGLRGQPHPEASSPPLRFPIDRTASLAQPTINVPEDVEESSRASSIIQYASYEESDTGHMRVGSIEALSTPAALSSPQRSSTMLSFERSSQNVAVPRIDSTYSSLGAPVSDAARSSYMTSGTGMSRMSGLSDFPVPPTDVTPEQLSVLNSYFDDSQSSQQFNGFLSPPRPGGLVREPSTNTFGGQNEIGQAL